MSAFNHITDLNNYGVNYNSTITLPCGETIMLNPFIYAKYLKFANAAKANANKRNDKNELALIHPITKAVYIPTMIKGVYLKAVCNTITDVAQYEIVDSKDDRLYTSKALDAVHSVNKKT